MSKKPEKPKKKPEPELSGRGRVGFHLIKFQVSRAMPKRNPKIRVGSGFGILQVFAHSRGPRDPRGVKNCFLTDKTDELLFQD